VGRNTCTDLLAEMNYNSILKKKIIYNKGQIMTTKNIENHVQNYCFQPAINMRLKLQILFILILLLSKGYAQVNYSSINEESSYSVNPFSDIGKNALDCFTKTNSIYHLAGLTSTYIIIGTGIDYKVHNYFVKNTQFEPYSVPAVYAGYVFPILLGGGLLAYGELKNSSREKTAASAVIQASLISLVYSSALKFITGRPNPEPQEYGDKSSSSTFRFGLNRGGMHFGWPSGHMMVNTAAVTSLLCFYKNNTELDILGSLYLGYLFYSVISHEKNTMHWFSDAITGTLMGYVIGSTIGKNFRGNFDDFKDKIGCELKIFNQFTGISINIQL
jgi:hypothetical protein